MPPIVVHLERTTTSEITESHLVSNWSAHGIDGPIRPILPVAVVSRNDRTPSRITIAVDDEGHRVGKLLVSLVRWQGRKDSLTNGRNLKERLEHGDEAERSRAEVGARERSTAPDIHSVDNGGRHGVVHGIIHGMAAVTPVAALAIEEVTNGTYWRSLSPQGRVAREARVSFHPSQHCAAHRAHASAHA